MEYRQLGNSGLRVSQLCLGSMQFGWTANEELAYEILNTAYASGINFVDTADIYSRWVPGNPGGVSETIIGNWMEKYQIPRDQLIIATKVRGRTGEHPNDEGLSRKHIVNAVDSSLRRLRTDYIDLYQAHWFDANVRIEETLSTLNDLVHLGKVRYIGCSNYPAWRLVESLWVAQLHGWSRFDTLQPHYNLVHRDEFERELSEVCQHYGLGVLPYSPLAGGFLTGKYRQDTRPESKRLGSAQKYFANRYWQLIDVMEDLGESLGGISISQVAIAWLLSKSLISSPIIGPRSVQQLNDNLGAVGIRIPQEQLTELESLTDWKNKSSDD